MFSVLQWIFPLIILKNFILLKTNNKVNKYSLPIPTFTNYKNLVMSIDILYRYPH